MNATEQATDKKAQRRYANAREWGPGKVDCLRQPREFETPIRIIGKRERVTSAWKILSRCWDENLLLKVRQRHNLVFATANTDDHVFLQIEPSVPGWVRGEIQDFITTLRKAGWRITKRHQYRKGYTVGGSGSFAGMVVEEARIPVYEIWT